MPSLASILIWFNCTLRSSLCRTKALGAVSSYAVVLCSYYVITEVSMKTVHSEVLVLRLLYYNRQTALTVACTQNKDYRLQNNMCASARRPSVQHVHLPRSTVT